MPNFKILYLGLPNLLWHFHSSLGRKVPKLLESYSNCNFLLKKSEHYRFAITAVTKQIVI